MACPYILPYACPYAIFVCAAGSRSKLAAQLAAALGFKEVYNLSGGTQAWRVAGLNVVVPQQQAAG